MKLSELIKKAQEALTAKGDMDVRLDNSFEVEEYSEVLVIDAEYDTHLKTTVFWIKI